MVCAGSAFPLRVSYEALDSPSPASLTSLEVRLAGRSVTRARNLLLGEKVAENETECVIASLQNLAIAIGPAPLTLSERGVSLELPRGLTPYFSSFNVCQEPYSSRIRYEVMIGSQRIKGSISDRQVEVLPCIYHAKSTT